MPVITFSPQVEALQAEGISIAKAEEPNFELARTMLYEAEYIVGIPELESEPGAAPESPLKAAIFSGRNMNDLGVVSVREGLFLRNHRGAHDEEAEAYVAAGIKEIELSYISLRNLLTDNAQTLTEKKWTESVHSHICGTMNTWFRATQTGQLLRNEIGPDKKANQAVVAAQWMLGRGTAKEPGAYVHGQRGNNGYYAVQTPFLGLRGEVINGGSAHLAKAIKWGAVRGIPELSRRVATDPDNRRQILLTVARLTLESTSRERAIAAALNHQRF
jgi:hypothetical protein